MGTGIEWCDETWNPVTGCSKVSAGCRFCYAQAIAARFWGDRAFTDVRIHPDRLEQPLKWRKPRRVFVNSMSDLFHEDINEGFIRDIFGTMALAPQHQYLVLTKRPERMRRLFDRGVLRGRHATEWPLPNVLLGVSCEDQATADDRIPILLDTPASVRWVSYEPGLGPVDFTDLSVRTGEQWNALDRVEAADAEPGSPSTTLDWIVVGGESGPGARPFDVQWARDTIAQCAAFRVPVFVKQLGARPVAGRTTRYYLDLRDRKGGDPGEWPEGLRVRQLPGSVLA